MLSSCHESHSACHSSSRTSCQWRAEFKLGTAKVIVRLSSVMGIQACREAHRVAAVVVQLLYLNWLDDETNTAYIFACSDIYYAANYIQRFSATRLWKNEWILAWRIFIYIFCTLPFRSAFLFYSPSSTIIAGQLVIYFLRLYLPLIYLYLFIPFIIQLPIYIYMCVLACGSLTYSRKWTRSWGQS